MFPVSILKSSFFPIVRSGYIVTQEKKRKGNSIITLSASFPSHLLY